MLKYSIFLTVSLLGYFISAMDKPTAEQIYQEALELIKDDDKVLKEAGSYYLEIAAEMDHVDAKYMLAMYLLNLPDDDDDRDQIKALGLLDQAADANHAKAQFTLYEYYSHKDHNEENPNLAMEYLKRSANLGYEVAARMLGIYLLDNPLSRDLAIEYLTSAASKNDLYAENILKSPELKSEIFIRAMKSTIQRHKDNKKKLPTEPIMVNKY